MFHSSVVLTNEEKVELVDFLRIQVAVLEQAKASSCAMCPNPLPDSEPHTMQNCLLKRLDVNCSAIKKLLTAFDSPETVEKKNLQ